MSIILRLAVIWCVLVFPAFAGTLRSVEGVVTRVTDGDTIQLVDHAGTKLRVRFFGIDAPETAHTGKPGQPYGDEAAAALKTKVSGQRVRLDIQAVDQYHRVVAIVMLSGRDVNKEMVAEGWAWAYRQYLDRPHASAYIRAEEEARSSRLGLWQQGNTQPPWAFRRSIRKGGGNFE